MQHVCLSCWHFKTGFLILFLEIDLPAMFSTNWPIGKPCKTDCWSFTVCQMHMGQSTKCMPFPLGFFFFIIKMYNLKVVSFLWQLYSLYLLYLITLLFHNYFYTSCFDIFVKPVTDTSVTIYQGFSKSAFNGPNLNIDQCQRSGPKQLVIAKVVFNKHSVTYITCITNKHFFLKKVFFAFKIH